VRSLWGGSWFLPLLPALYAALLAVTGGLRASHIMIGIAIAGLGFATATTKRAVFIAYPVLLIGLAFDIMWRLQPLLVLPKRVLGCQMRAFELALFAEAPGVTWQDYFSLHNTHFFDLVFAIPYATFLLVVILYAIYLSFADELRARQFIWAITVAYLLAIVLYMALPATPPWYVRMHGCTIDTAALPSAAGLLRVDHLLGLRYFETIYKGNPAIFASFPSMHCAFPVAGLIVSWRKAGWATRPVHILYAAAMFIGSIYLDHHWTIDGPAGWLVAALGSYAAFAIVRRPGNLPPGGERLDPDAVITS
jgi:hypothetical protein